MGSGRFARAKEFAVQGLEEFARELWQAAERNRSRGRWFIADPYRADAKPGNLSLFLSGPKRGGFRDFESGLAGDALDFVAHGLCGRIDAASRLAAVEHIEARYGLRDMDPKQAERIRAESAARRAAAEAQAARDLKARRDKARKRFWAMTELDADDAAPVRAYLAGRGIDLAAVPNMAPSFRCDPDAQYWRDKTLRFPALVSAMVDGGGQIGANHFTFVRADGGGKAPVDKAKLMYPESFGLVIRAVQGPSGLGAEKHAAAGGRDIVALTEGVEDALSVALADPSLRVWACGSLAGLGQVPDHAVAAGWLIFQDNDWDKPEAQKQFAAAVARIRTFGKPVEVVSAPAELGKDMNDVIRSK